MIFIFLSGMSSSVVIPPFQDDCFGLPIYWNLGVSHWNQRFEKRLCRSGEIDVDINNFLRFLNVRFDSRGRGR